MATYRVRVDSQSGKRQAWAAPNGIPEGSDFTLEAMHTVRGATDTSTITSSGTFVLTVSDSVLNGGTALLSAVSGTLSTSVIGTGLTTFTITDTTSSTWEGGTYNGDIKLTDSGSLVTFFPISLTVREPKG